MTYYNDEHAAVFDAFKSREQYRSEATQLLPIFQARDVTRIVDVGCGTGGHAAELHHEGYEVLGIDIDQSILSVGRSKHPGIMFKHQSADEPLPETDAVTLFDSVFTYLNPDQRSQALMNYAKALSSDGVLYLDIAFSTDTTPSSFGEDRETTTWNNTTHEKIAKPKRQENRVESDIIIRDRDEDRVIDETTHTHYLVEPTNLRDELQDNDFTILKEAGHQQSPWQNWEIICARR